MKFCRQEDILDFEVPVTAGDGGSVIGRSDDEHPILIIEERDEI